MFENTILERKYSSTLQLPRQPDSGGEEDFGVVRLSSSMRESHQRYFISWRGRCLLVSAPNLRPASELEALDQEERREEARALEEQLENKEYEDLSNQAPPEEDTPGAPDDSWVPQEGVIRKSAKGGRSKQKAAEVAKLLKGARVKIKTIKSIKKEKKKKNERPAVLRQPGVSNRDQAEEIEKKNEELRQQLDIFMKQPRTEEIDTEVRRNLQDDVPLQFKRKRLDEEEIMDEDGLRKRIRRDVLNYTMLASTPRRDNGRSNEWATKAEVKKLASLLDLPIVNVRYHLAPRKRFQKPPSRTLRWESYHHAAGASWSRDDLPGERRGHEFETEKEECL